MPEEQLRQRSSALEAAEVEALRASLPAPPEGAKGAKSGGGGGAKDKGLAPGGHNNEKDFQRRLDVWLKARSEDALELKERVRREAGI